MEATLQGQVSDTATASPSYIAMFLLLYFLFCLLFFLCCYFLVLVPFFLSVADCTETSGSSEEEVARLCPSKDYNWDIFSIISIKLLTTMQY